MVGSLLKKSSFCRALFRWLQYMVHLFMEGEGESEIERARARKIERDGGRGGGVGVSNPVIFAGWQRFIVNPLNFEVTL